MTFKQIKQSILALGFETEFPSDEALLCAINRAARWIGTERGAVCVHRLFADTAKGTQLFFRHVHHGGESDVFTLSGKAYCFAVCGNGSFTVHTGDRSETFSFSGNHSVFRGFLAGEGQIVFSGEHLFTIYRLTVFSDTVSDLASQIPAPDGERVLQMEDMVDDFLCFYAAPTDESGKVRTDVRLDGGQVFLPTDCTGEVRIPYRHLPREMSGLSDEETLDLPRECEPLLPLLAAHFIWLDDDADKATEYMARYREALATIRRETVSAVSPRYEDVIGW